MRATTTCTTYTYVYDIEYYVFIHVCMSHRFLIIILRITLYSLTRLHPAARGK